MAWPGSFKHTLGYENLQLLSDLRFDIPVFRVEKTEFVRERIGTEKVEFFSRDSTNARKDVGQPLAVGAAAPFDELEVTPLFENLVRWSSVTIENDSNQCGARQARQVDRTALPPGASSRRPKRLPWHHRESRECVSRNRLEVRDPECGQIVVQE